MKRLRRGLWFAALAGFGFGATMVASAAETVLVPAKSVWRYLDDGSAPAADWMESQFDDAGWGTGRAVLGYGGAAKGRRESTVVRFGPEPTHKFATTYFRRRFEVPDGLALAGARVRLLRDDGAVVYLDGAEVFRSNLPDGLIQPDTLASKALSGAEETVWEVELVEAARLGGGGHVLAVEVHQAARNSSDLSFDLELVGSDQPRVVRGPYLQQTTGDGVVVRWRTDAPTDSRVVWGRQVPDPAQAVVNPAHTVEHEIRLAGLQPGTDYVYEVGSSERVLARGPECRFRTAPREGSTEPVRVWLLGDYGYANADARSVRDSAAAWCGPRLPDVWLSVGDNEQTTGADRRYQKAVFGVYSNWMARLSLWPTIGNHDLNGASAPGVRAPYHRIFTLPQAGEAGGVASGTENYYSFNHALVHFVCLDSQASDRSAHGAMARWLEADLRAARQRWIVAYWHHPPYSRGTHDSDSDKHMKEMRQNLVPILERGGVDLVFCGHTHVYERSLPLIGHYGSADTFDWSMTRGFWVPEGSRELLMPAPGSEPRRTGVVYVNIGVGSRVGKGAINHPSMRVSFRRLGSLFLDVEPDRAVGRMLDVKGVVRDEFEIRKSGPSR